MHHVRQLFSRWQRQQSGTRIVAGAFVSLIVLLSSGSAEAQGRFDDLLRRIPASANALMVIDVKAVHSSPLAVKEGWNDRHQAAYVKKPFILSPESDRLVLAAQMNPNRNFEQAWELAVMSLTESLSMNSIARAEGGYVDKIAGLSAAWTPSDAYFVSFEPKTMGVMHPAHRQAVSRWADYSRQKRAVAVSPYLKQAVGMVNGSTQIVMAIDLHDVVQPHKLKEALKESELTSGSEAKQREWAKIISGIQGVTLKVQIGNTARGTLQVDFAEDTAPFGKDARDLVLNVLDKYGAGIAEMREWKAKAQDYSVVLEGNLTTSGMRRLFSLLELPSSKFSDLKDESPGDSGDTQSMVKSSQAYFKSVSTLLDDLRKEFRTNRDARKSYAAVFMERYGRRIDRLSILNVDEDLLAYGARVAETLRSASISKRMAGVRSGVRKSQVYGNYSYNYNGNGYHSARKSSSVRTQVRREEQAKASQVRFESGKEIADATAAIRKTMTRKYMVQF